MERKPLTHRTWAAAAALAWSAASLGADAPAPDKAPPPEPLKAERQSVDGSLVLAGKRVDYQAVSGTLVVHPEGWDDVPQNADKDKPAAEATMSFVAYLAKGAAADAPRPLVFLYNGGPGSATIWLHMGAFGPRRVLTANDSHTPAAPYRIVPNAYSLLDVADLVFIDAPATGFGRIAGKDREKAFFGVDADAHAFAEFISQFLTQFERWNAPKFLFGESYGTTRNAVLANLLQTQYSIDLNGVINLSQISYFDASTDFTDASPGADLQFVLSLPTFAATAWYHHRLAPAVHDLQPLLEEVEHFAMNDYALALLAGSALENGRRQDIIRRLHDYTGLPEAYIAKANLRVSGGEFEKALAADTDTTVGRLDTRFSGPTLDPLSKEAQYDPQEAAIASAYVAAFNAYARSELHAGHDRTYKAGEDLDKFWDYRHKPPGAEQPLPMSTNVLPDLAQAMKANPHLRVMFNGGYYDLATPFFATIYERDHLPVPADLRARIVVKFYESGHMVYAHEPSHKALHDNVAAFIREASNPGK